MAEDQDAPAFSRPLDRARLAKIGAALPFDEAPSAEERAALSDSLGLRKLRKLRFHGALMPLAGGGYHLTAELGATVVQACVVTLEDVTTRLDLSVERRFLPDLPAGAAEITVDPDDDDSLEPLGEGIDLGAVASEALALALPDYPRAEGAALPEDGAEDAGEDRPSPFAGLAALKDRLQ